MASLFESIVQQNLSVLTRGHTLRPAGAAAGRPEHLHPRHAGSLAREHPADVGGARGRRCPTASTRGADRRARERAVLRRPRRRASSASRRGRRRRRLPRHGDAASATSTWAASRRSRRAARRRLWARRTPSWTASRSATAARGFAVPRRFAPGEVVRGVRRPRRRLHLHQGGAARAASASVLAKAYQLSQGQSDRGHDGDLPACCASRWRAQGATLEVLGVGTTGYAKDVLKDALGADVALVETVAHTESALHFYDDVDVICDVGGQDIKLIILKNGQVKDFKLNTQCSAGNGYFLQSTAPGLRLRRGGVRRGRLQRRGDAQLRLRLRGVHAVGHRGLPAPGLAAEGDHGRAWPPCCPRTSGSTSRRSRTWPSSAGASCCRAARSTTWPR